MSESIVIVGAGGFGREVLDVLRATDPLGTTWNFIGFVADDEPERAVLKRINATWLGSTHEFLEKPSATHFVIGIGDPCARMGIAQQFTAADVQAATLIHPSATIGQDVEIGSGSIICSHVSITTNVRLGHHVHVNLNSTIGHDTNVGNFVTINPLTAISGNVVIGDGVMLGTSSAVLQGLSLSEASVVGAGAVVVRDVEPGTTVVGVPARPLGRTPPQ